MSNPYYVNPPHYEPSDVFWELLSVLILPIEQQVIIIGGLPDKPSSHPTITNSFLFATALETYKGSWVDEFDVFYSDPLVEDSIYTEFTQVLEDITEKDCDCIQGFYSERWARLRELAVAIFKDVDLPPLNIDKAIDFRDLVRVFINSNGEIQVD